MVKKEFGYPLFDETGEMILTTYDNEYSDMMMDIRVYKAIIDDSRTFMSVDEETAILLLNGKIEIATDGILQTVSRRDVFTDGPYAIHFSKGEKVFIRAMKDTEYLVQKTKNDNKFITKLYEPKDVPWQYSGALNKFGNVANRRVNTIFDYEIEPLSNMVLGEVLNDPGNWSGFLPHRHPQPECYYFLFDHPEGFGASFVGDHVFKSIHRSFSAISGGKLHPQAVAPGYQMYTCWMIRHLDGKPWLQTDRCEDETFTWLHNAQFDKKTNSFHKK